MKVLAEQAVARKKTELQVSYASSVHVLAEMLNLLSHHDDVLYDDEACLAPTLVSSRLAMPRSSQCLLHFSSLPVLPVT